MITYNNKTAIVTGAASGIGLEIAKQLIQRGAIVWLTDINEAALTTAAKNLDSNAHSLVLDVRDADGIKNLVTDIVTKHNSLDFIFNNAGIGVGGEMQDLTGEQFDRIIDINVKGVINGVLAAYPIMVQQKSGYIINTASGAGFFGLPLLAPYSMSKHAVVGFSKSLRIEAAYYGIQVNTLCPSAIETPLLDSKDPEDATTTNWTPNFREYLSKISAPVPVEDFVTYTFKQLDANKEFIIAPAKSRLSKRLSGIFPNLVTKKLQKLHQYILSTRETS